MKSPVEKINVQELLTKNREKNKWDMEMWLSQFGGNHIPDLGITESIDLGHQKPAGFNGILNFIQGGQKDERIGNII